LSNELTKTDVDRQIKNEKIKVIAISSQ